MAAGGWVSNGTTQYLKTADAVALRPGTGNWTIAVRCTLPNANRAGVIVCKRLNSGTYTQLTLEQGTVTAPGSTTPSKNISIVDFDGANKRFLASNGAVADGNSHVLVIIRDLAGGYVFYVDGTSVAYTVAASSGTPNVNTTADWEYPCAAILLDYTNAAMALYNVALTAPQAVALSAAMALL